MSLGKQVRTGKSSVSLCFFNSLFCRARQFKGKGIYLNVNCADEASSGAWNTPVPALLLYPNKEWSFSYKTWRAFNSTQLQPKKHENTDLKAEASLGFALMNTIFHYHTSFLLWALLSFRHSDREQVPAANGSGHPPCLLLCCILRCWGCLEPNCPPMHSVLLEKYSITTEIHTFSP